MVRRKKYGPKRPKRQVRARTSRSLDNAATRAHAQGMVLLYNGGGEWLRMRKDPRHV